MRLTFLVCFAKYCYYIYKYYYYYYYYYYTDVM